MTPRVLVMAKAPVPGLAKTRLGRSVGMAAAADLAAAALLDTLDAARHAFDRECYLALTGDLASGVRGSEISAALVGWTCFDQVGETFADRLVHAHATVAGAGPGPVVQIGMDTPQVTAEQLREVAAPLADGATAVLAPAEDGGWWALALADGSRAVALAAVPMSEETTHQLSLAALLDQGDLVATGRRLRDVDTVADAAAVARSAPWTRFARAWTSLGQVAS